MLHATPLRADEPPLAAYNADIAQTSISGISSGAFMAVQFGMAWSSIVIGVGAVAGGPFGCSDGSASAALSTCMTGEPAPDVAALIARTDAWSRSGAIDDAANIARQRIYLFSGYNDSVVMRPVSNALHAFYDHYRPGSLFYQTAIGSGHAQVTIAYGGGCADNGGEFINRCDYDQAGIILQHSYGVLQPRNDGTLGGHVVSFRQADFTGSRMPIDDSLDDRGFAYVPAACASREPCRVHVALHGCLQSESDIGEDFVRHAGYNEWADTNRIIVLYPQIKAVDLTQFGVTNPQSCWDWWGYLDADPTQSPTWLLKTGKQIVAIKAMIDRITSGAVASAAPIAATLAPPATVIALDASDSAYRPCVDGRARCHGLRCVPGGWHRSGVPPDRHGRRTRLWRCRADAGNRLPLQGARRSGGCNQRLLGDGRAADPTQGAAVRGPGNLRRALIRTGAAGCR